MTLNEIGMVAADTSRTFYYLEGLIRHKLHPSHVLLLINNEENLLPGQNNSESLGKIIKKLESAAISFEISPNNDINSKKFRHSSTEK